MKKDPSDPVDKAMVELETIADRLQRGAITLEEADAESRFVRDALTREMKSATRAPVAGTPASRLRRTIFFEPRATTTDPMPVLSVIWTTLVLLTCVIGGIVVVVRASNSDRPRRRRYWAFSQCPVV